jgi:hypothetical protein
MAELLYHIAQAAENRSKETRSKRSIHLRVARCVQCVATIVPVYPLFRVRYRVQMASIASVARIHSLISTSRETLVAAGLISMVAHGRIANFGRTNHAKFPSPRTATCSEESFSNEE